MTTCKCGNRKTRIGMCNTCYTSLTSDQRSVIIGDKLRIQKSPPKEKIDFKYLLSIIMLILCLVGFIILFIIMDNLVPGFKGVYSVLSIIVLSGLLFILFSNK